MTRFKTIAAVALAVAALAAPGASFAKSYVGVDSVGDNVKLGLEQLNTDQQTEIVNRADDVNVVVRQINKGSRARVIVTADRADPLIVSGQCPLGKVSRAVVTGDGAIVPRCY